MKLLPSVQKRFDEMIEQYTATNLVITKEDAMVQLDGIAASEFGQKLSKLQPPLDQNEWTQGLLIDALRDEIGRGILNPVYKMRIRVRNVHVFDYNVHDDDGNATDKNVRKASIAGTIVLQQPKTKFWNDPQPGEVSGEGAFADILEDTIQEGNTYELEASATAPDVKYIFLKIDERCDKKIAKVDAGEIPLFDDLMQKSTDITPIHSAKDQPSKGNFDFKLFIGRVVEHPTTGGAGKKGQIHLADGSVTAEDIARDGNKAYLTVKLTPEQMIYGKNSILMIYGIVRYDPTKPQFGPTMWNSRWIIPIVAMNMPEGSSRISSAKAASSENKVQKASSVVQQIRDRAMMAANKTTPNPETPAAKAVESISTPIAKRRVVEESAPAVDVAVFQKECPAFGVQYDPVDTGCVSCQKEWQNKGEDPSHIYPNCIKKFKG